MSRRQTQQQRSDNVETDKLCTAQSREEVEMTVGFCAYHLVTSSVSDEIIKLPAYTDQFYW
jgi:hypothetical protein